MPAADLRPCTCGCEPDPATVTPRTVAEAIALAKRARRIWLTCSPVADRFIFVHADKDDVLRELARLPADAKPVARFHLAAAGSLWLG